MTGAKHLGGLAAAGFAALALAGARSPAALASASPGLWEIEGGPRAVRMCVRDLAELAQFEHRGRSCTRVVISDGANATVIHYTCPGTDFGRSKLTPITPRNIRIETSGISANAPFSYLLQARRVSNC